MICNFQSASCMYGRAWMGNRNMPIYLPQRFCTERNCANAVSSMWIYKDSAHVTYVDSVTKWKRFGAGQLYKADLFARDRLSPLPTFSSTSQMPPTMHAGGNLLRCAFECDCGSASIPFCLFPYPKKLHPQLFAHHRHCYSS